MTNKKYLTLKEIQEEELKIVKNVVDFLNKNNLKYYMWAGTFLGAVRHKGFIPWDDDIDLAMTRPEYDKLIDILKENDLKIADNLIGSCFELGNSKFPFLKIINKNIRLEEQEKCDEYLWIDIFPLDAAPENNSKYYKKMSFYKKVYGIMMRDNDYLNEVTKNPIKKLFKKCLILGFKIVTPDKFIKKYIKMCKKYNYDKYDYLHNNVWASTSNVYHKDKFVSKKYKFEDVELNGVEDYDYFLKGYGDYMKLPPKDKRVSHEFKAWRVK